MRFKERQRPAFTGGDMSPMIDMTFQLIAFFMVLINFADADQNQRIHLPSSELAKPAETPFETPITLQLTKEGTVFFGGEEVSIDAMKILLRREAEFLKAKQSSPADATIILRADADAKTGVVQQLIQICQESGFEKFALRAKQQEGT